MVCCWLSTAAQPSRLVSSQEQLLFVADGAQHQHQHPSPPEPSRPRPRLGLHRRAEASGEVIALVWELALRRLAPATADAAGEPSASMCFLHPAMGRHRWRPMPVLLLLCH